MKIIYSLLQNRTNIDVRTIDERHIIIVDAYFNSNFYFDSIAQFTFYGYDTYDTEREFITNKKMFNKLINFKFPEYYKQIPSKL